MNSRFHVTPCEWKTRYVILPATSTLCQSVDCGPFDFWSISLCCMASDWTGLKYPLLPLTYFSRSWIGYWLTLWSYYSDLSAMQVRAVLHFVGATFPQQLIIAWWSTYQLTRIKLPSFVILQDLVYVIPKMGNISTKHKHMRLSIHQLWCISYLSFVRRHALDL